MSSGRSATVERLSVNDAIFVERCDVNVSFTTLCDGEMSKYNLKQSNAANASVTLNNGLGKQIEEVRRSGYHETELEPYEYTEPTKVGRQMVRTLRGFGKETFYTFHFKRLVWPHTW